MIRSAAGYGSGRSKTALTMLKIAVFAPIPSASVSTATRVNPGDLRSWRKANFRSFMLFSAQSDDWIDARSAACWNPGRQECGREKKRNDANVNSRLDPFDFEKHAL